MDDFDTRAATLKKELKDLAILKNMTTTQTEIDMVYKRLEKCMDEYADMVNDLEVEDFLENGSHMLTCPEV